MLKKIEAIIREEKLDPVRIAVEQVGYRGITVTKVSGRGKQGGIKLQRRTGEYSVDLLPKIKIEIVVIANDVPKVVNKIISIARTGEVGDGKIFILPVENVIRIRTGDEGENAI